MTVWRHVGVYCVTLIVVLCVSALLLFSAERIDGGAANALRWTAAQPQP